jgi:hypothetical protein
VWRGYAENHCIHLEIRELNLNYGIYERNNKQEKVVQNGAKMTKCYPNVSPGWKRVGKQYRQYAPTI